MLTNCNTSVVDSNEEMENRLGWPPQTHPIPAPAGTGPACPVLPHFLLSSPSATPVVSAGSLSRAELRSEIPPPEHPFPGCNLELSCGPGVTLHLTRAKPALPGGTGLLERECQQPSKSLCHGSTAWHEKQSCGTEKQSSGGFWEGGVALVPARASAPLSKSSLCSQTESWPWPLVPPAG